MSVGAEDWPHLPDRFEVVGELGRGASGVVYRATQSELGRDVAVKVLAPGGQVMRVALERFEREARVLARLRHPRIVPIHEVGRVAGGVYFSMGLLSGGSLADRLADAEGGLPIADVTCLGQQVCEALAHVHEQGIVHRDLKPSNVLLDHEGNACVADFGLALDAVGESPATATGRILGTPDYMAPEQLVGGRPDITERTDVYALGVLLYECLTGRRPFAGRSLADKVHAVVHSDPPRLRTVNPAVPRALERIVQQAMRKDPAERYASAQELARDLERFESGHTVQAARQRISFSVAPGRAMRIAVAAAVGGLIAAAALWFLGAFERSPSQRLEDARRLEASGEMRAAQLIYRDALERLRGKELSDAAAQELAVEGLAAEMAAYDYAPDEERAERLERLVEDVDWMAAALGLGDLRVRLLRRALAHRGAGDMRAIDSDDYSWFHRTYYSQTVREVDGFVRAVEDAERYLFGREHPLRAAACGLFDWSLSEVKGGLAGDSDRPWAVVLPGLAEANAREDRSDGYGWTLKQHQLGPLRAFGPGLRARDFEQDLLRVCLLPALEDEQRAVAALLAARMLDLPPPVAHDREQRPVLLEDAFERLSSIVERHSGGNGAERWLAVGECAASMLDTIGADDDLNDHFGIRHWLGRRGFANDRRSGSNLQRWRAWSSRGASSALAASLELVDVEAPIWIEHLAEEEDTSRRYRIHERLLLETEAPRDAPIWNSTVGSPPVDLVERWREHFELGGAGPYGLDVAVLGWSTGVEAPVLLATERRVFDPDEAAAWSIEFDLRPEARYERFPNLIDQPTREVEVRQGTARLRLEPRPFEAFGGRAIEPGFDLRVRPAGSFEAATPLVQPQIALPFDGVGVYVATINRGWASSGGAILERLAVVARAWSAEGDERPRAIREIDDVIAELERDFARRGDALALEREHEAYWEGPSPMLLALFAHAPEHRGLRERLLRALETTTVGPFSSSSQPLQIRGFELALGGPTRSVVERQLDRSLHPEPYGGYFQIVGLATALLSADDDRVRAEAATLFHGQNLWGNEREVVHEAWRRADEAMPGHLFDGPPPTDVQRLRVRVRQVAPFLPLGFLLALLALSRGLRLSPLATGIATLIVGYGVWRILDEVRDLPTMTMQGVAMAGAFAAIDAGVRPRALLRALPFPIALAAFLQTKGSLHAEAWLALAHGAIIVGAWCVAAAPSTRGRRMTLAVAAGLVTLAFLPELSGRFLLWLEAAGLAAHLPLTPDITTRTSLAGLGALVALFSLLPVQGSGSGLAPTARPARDSG